MTEPSEQADRIFQAWTQSHDLRERHRRFLTSKNIGFSYPLWSEITPETILGFMHVTVPKEEEPDKFLEECAEIALECFIESTIEGMRKYSSQTLDCLSEIEWETIQTTSSFSEFVALVDRWVANCIKKIEKGNFIKEVLEEHVVGRPFFPRNHLGLVKAVLKWKGVALKYATQFIQDDREAVSTAVNSDGRALKYASLRLKNNPTIVLEAIASRHSAFESAPEFLRHDKQFIIKAVRNNGLVLRCLKFRALNEDIAITQQRIIKCIDYYLRILDNTHSKSKMVFRIEGEKLADLLEELQRSPLQREERTRLMGELQDEVRRSLRELLKGNSLPSDLFPSQQ